MSTFLRNKAISKTRPLRKENPFPQFNVASNKRPGIGLSFEYTTTLLSGEGEEGRTGTTTTFKKRLSKYTIFSTVLSKIVESHSAIASCDSYASFVFSNLPRASITPWLHAARLPFLKGWEMFQCLLTGGFKWLTQTR